MPGLADLIPVPNLLAFLNVNFGLNSTESPASSSPLWRTPGVLSSLGVVDSPQQPNKTVAHALTDHFS